MITVYDKLIPENIAPIGTTKIAIYDKEGTTKVGDLRLGRLKHPDRTKKLYTFGLLSDTHISIAVTDRGKRLAKAITFFKNEKAKFLCLCGDMTDTGLWRPVSGSSSKYYYNPEQLVEFIKICNDNNMPFYSNCGNHESYANYDIAGTYTDVNGTDPTLVINNLEKYKYYTGKDLVFTMTQDDDVYIFVGQSTQSKPMTVEHLKWLYNTLEDNRNKRCFVFIHPYISGEDSGNPLGLHDQALFTTWGATNTKAFTDLMAHYQNATLFHGHSHTHFCTQEQDSHAVYSTNLGFRSIHVPSSANARLIINGSLGTKDASYSLGYLVDVYADCIVLNGLDIVNNKYVPIGTYKINTALVNIPEKTFVDTTGVIIPK